MIFGFFFILLGIVLFFFSFMIRMAGPKIVNDADTKLEFKIDELSSLGDHYKAGLIQKNKWVEFNDRISDLETKIHQLKTQVGYDPFILKPSIILSMAVGLLYFVSGMAFLFHVFWARIVLLYTLAVNIVLYFCIVFISPIAIGSFMNRINMKVNDAINLVQQTPSFVPENIIVSVFLKALPLHLIFIVYVINVGRYFSNLKNGEIR